ncbi:hypothetical protein A8G17_38170 [Escherichia coli]|nr:hypothetical protein A8G17_38170 [Escherichia coli]
MFAAMVVRRLTLNLWKNLWKTSWQTLLASHVQMHKLNQWQKEVLMGFFFFLKKLSKRLHRLFYGVIINCLVTVIRR